MLNAAIWPTSDYSGVPCRLHHDPEAYQREQERIFRGPTWNFLGLEAEIPNLGDFRTTYVGDTPVIVNRDANGTIHALQARWVADAWLALFAATCTYHIVPCENYERGLPAGLV